MVCKHSGFSYKPKLCRLDCCDPKMVFIPYFDKIHICGDLFVERDDSINSKEFFSQPAG
jgi:hypothetical protein